MSRSVMSSLGGMIVYGDAQKRARRRRRRSKKSSMAETAATATSVSRAIPMVLVVGRVVCTTIVVVSGESRVVVEGVVEDTEAA